MIIPYQDLEPETLTNLIEHFIARETTDYGAVEASMDDKIATVRQQLNVGQAVIVFSEEDGSCNIVPKHQVSEIL